MAPTTRSASRKTRLSSSTVYPNVKKRVKSIAQPKPTIKSPARRNTPGKKTVGSPPMSSPKPTATPEGSSTANRSERPVLEWVSVESSQFRNIAELLELMDVLREIRRQPGCVSARRQSRDEFSAPEYFTIGWFAYNFSKIPTYRSESMKLTVGPLQSGINPRTGHGSSSPRHRSVLFGLFRRAIYDRPSWSGYLVGVPVVFIPGIQT